MSCVPSIDLLRAQLMSEVFAQKRMGIERDKCPRSFAVDCEQLSVFKSVKSEVELDFSHTRKRISEIWNCRLCDQGTQAVSRYRSVEEPEEAQDGQSALAFFAFLF